MISMNRPFEQCFAYSTERSAKGYTQAYVPIVENAKHALYGRGANFNSIVAVDTLEFNLVLDRAARCLACKPVGVPNQS